MSEFSAKVASAKGLWLNKLELPFLGTLFVFWGILGWFFLGLLAVSMDWSVEVFFLALIGWFLSAVAILIRIIYWHFKHAPH